MPKFTSEQAINQRLRQAFPAVGPTLSPAMPQEADGVEFAVGNLTLSDEDGQTTQAGAYAEAEGWRLPVFILQPKTGLLSLAPGMMGKEAVRIDNEDFSRAYHLCADHPENARRLFNQDVVAWLAARPGLHLGCLGLGLLLYWVGQSYGSRPEHFAREAAELFALLVRAHRDAPPAAPRAPKRTEELTTRADVAAFLAQPVPRALPTNVRLYCDRCVPPLLLFIGFFFALGGLVLTGRLVAHGDWGASLLGMAFLAVGAPIAFFSARARARLKRLLRRGQVSSARIEHIEETGMWMTGRGAIRRVRLSYAFGGQAREGRCQVAGHGLERAQARAEAGKPVEILYDPEHPERVLFMDDVLTLSPEYEA